MRRLLGLAVIVFTVALIYSPVHAAILSYHYSGILDPIGGIAWGSEGAYGLAPDSLTATVTGEFTYDDESTPVSGWYPLLTFTFVPQLDSRASSLIMTSSEDAPHLNTVSNTAVFNPAVGDPGSQLGLFINYDPQSYALFLNAMVVANLYSSNAEHGTWEVTSISLNTDGGNPVPEPATMLLLGSGLIGLVGLGRKKFFKA